MKEGVGFFTGGTVSFRVELFNFACTRQDVDRSSLWGANPLCAFLPLSRIFAIPCQPHWCGKKNNMKSR